MIGLINTAMNIYTTIYIYRLVTPAKCEAWAEIIIIKLVFTENWRTAEIKTIELIFTEN